MTVSNDAYTPSVSIETLGCKVNLFESEYIYHQLQSADWIKADAGAADLCVINTCTVTKEADRQSRQAIRRTIRNNPDATVVVTGCYAEVAAPVLSVSHAESALECVQLACHVFLNKQRHADRILEAHAAHV